MLDDLVESHLPIGMLESDVVALIGEPTTRYGDDESVWIIGENYHWYYGESQLEIHFGKDHRLVDAQLYFE
jgi:hypothetical protein